VASAVGNSHAASSRYRTRVNGRSPQGSFNLKDMLPASLISFGITAVFFNRLGGIRDRSFENQRYRASGLNLVVAAIALWNTVYLERAAEALARTRTVDYSLFQHVSPLGWEHINQQPTPTHRPLRQCHRCTLHTWSA